MPSLHLRRHPQNILRTYNTSFSSASSITPSPADQRAFLRHRDQHLLRDTLSHTKALTAHIQNLATHLRTHPPALINPPPGSNLTQPYILGRQRLKLDSDLPAAEAKVVQNAERISYHLTDLMFEPYPSYHDPNGERAANPHMVFEDKVARMSHAERREQLALIRLEEDAVAGRLKRETEVMRRKVEEMHRVLEGREEGQGEMETRPAQFSFARVGGSVVRKSSSSAWGSSPQTPRAEEAQAKVTPSPTSFGALKQSLVGRVKPVAGKATPKPKAPQATTKSINSKATSPTATLKAPRAEEYAGGTKVVPTTEVKAKPAEVKTAPLSLMDMQKRIDELNKGGSG